MIEGEQGPMKKLKILNDVNVLLLECVDDFWKDVPIDKKNLVIAADDMMPIYIYLVVRAKMTDIYA